MRLGKYGVTRMKKQLKLIIMVAGVFMSFVASYEVLPPRSAGKTINNYDGIIGVVNHTPGLKVQYWYKDELFATKDLCVFHSQDKGLTWEKIAKLGTPNVNYFKMIKYWLGRLRVVREITHNTGIDQLRVLKDRTIILSYGGFFYSGKLADGEVVRLKNTHSCMGSVLHQGCTEDPDGVVYIGQYITDSPGTRHKVTNLYWSNDLGTTWSVRNEFPRTDIRHIHSVAYDPYRKMIWLATGDDDHESRLLYSDNQCASFHVLGSGTQKWKAVSLQFTRDAVYWGSDIPGDTNYLFRWNWNTGQKDVLLTERNPFYYSVQDGKGNIFFSTTVEHPESDGFSTPYSEIWKIPKGDKLPVRLIGWRKGKLKTYGRIQFAQGEPPLGWIAFTPINLEKHHCETIVMKVRNEANVSSFLRHK